MTIDYSHVPRLVAPAAALSGTQAVRRTISFPATGGVQVVDVNGAVTTIAGSSGGDAALLAATQTFTGKNTFAPAAASIAGGAPSFAVDLSATQTLPAGATSFQPATIITAPSTAGRALRSTPRPPS